MTFTAEVYDQIRAGAIRSAGRIVPYVYELLHPKSVVDVGCGEGWFARKFAAKGCHVVALDREVEEGNRDGVHFLPYDIPGKVFGGFDLAVCLEVAEHLPESDADALVSFLTDSAPYILWSAAIPGQSGHGHVNCQWPDYWDEKFQKHGYAASESLRWRFWDDDEVEPWYRQNLLLYGERDRLVRLGTDVCDSPPPSVIHPGIWAWKQ